jgi:hypothetical protein
MTQNLENLREEEGNISGLAEKLQQLKESSKSKEQDGKLYLCI